MAVKKEPICWAEERRGVESRSRRGRMRATIALVSRMWFDVEGRCWKGGEETEERRERKKLRFQTATVA